MTNTPPTAQNAVAGWYPQPDGQQRYWDGQRWTEHLAPGPSPTASMAPATPGQPSVPGSVKAARRWYTKKRVMVPVGGLLLIGALTRLPSSTAPDTSAAAGTTTTPAKAASTSTAAAKPAAKPAAPAATTAAKEVADSMAKIGTPARDGKFEFLVSGLKCGIGKVGSEYLNKTAQGQFCAVAVSVKNIGEEAQSIFADNQVAFDMSGKKFSADSTAGIYADDSKLLYEEINPGNSVAGKIYFDVPKGTKLVKLDLHDSAFSGGVEVRLG